MPRVASETKTKAATRSANVKTKKTKASEAKTKTKRAPSAYNLFVKEHLKKWKENNPDKQVKEGMAAVAVLWRDAPENPKSGQGPAATKEMEAKANKENTKKPKSKKKEATPEEGGDELEE